MKIGENTIFRQYFADICSFRGQREEKIVLFGRIFPIFRLPDSRHADAAAPQRENPRILCYRRMRVLTQLHMTLPAATRPEARVWVPLLPRARDSALCARPG